VLLGRKALFTHSPTRSQECR